VPDLSEFTWLPSGEFAAEGHSDAAEFRVADSAKGSIQTQISATRNACCQNDKRPADLGCCFFNPFTNSVAVSAVNNQTNPYYRGNQNPAVINNPQLVEWLYGNYTNEFTNDIVSFDAVLSGELPLNLWGDNIGWAAGGQVRYNKFTAEYDDLFNTDVNPCVDSVNDVAPGCANASDRSSSSQWPRLTESCIVKRLLSEQRLQRAYLY
jgi:hypothetical protein